eukprot:5441068-Alexandrium_andersonii.AAC.1
MVNGLLVERKGNEGQGTGGTTSWRTLPPCSSTNSRNCALPSRIGPSVASCWGPRAPSGRS